MGGLLLDTMALFGEDALSNHFQMIIPSFPNVLQLPNLNMRVLSVEIPDQTIDTYDLTKRGKKFSRPSGLSEQEKTFTFTYRVDKYFQVYQGISQWLAYIQNPVTLAMASDSGPLGAGGPSTYRVPIIINGLDTNDIITNVWTFTGCFPTTQDGISFEEESSDPIIKSVTMSYINLYYPGMIPIA
jgi:hypothetical protein